ncbi:MAG TPA: chalcone isomerase family protein [Candidatus Sulfotelmatobacter sp.]
MRNFVASALILLLLVTAVASLRAGTLAAVTLPDKLQADSASLQLNGMGLRTKFMVKVYVAGLYLPQKSSDVNAILKADIPKQIVMHFVREITKNQLTDGFAESFHNNTPEAEKALKSDIDRLFAALGPVKDGEEIAFIYLPDKGTSVVQAGTEKVTISGPAFAKMLFSVWLGPKPPNVGLKKGLLGQL